ncbi:MAG TPA: hypothetical protein VFI49_03340 [Rudaea sp.]|nr:hypothetical protein [Rudaea sp.]
MTTGRAAIEASSHCAAIEAPPRCAACTFFCSDPQELESRIAGLRSFGSGFASVRAGDGLCAKHGRYLPASAHCASFERRPLLAANTR